jgi:hypothetical protein
MSLQFPGSSFTSNEDGAARSLMRGISLVHRKLTKSQRAVIVANIDDGAVPYQPTQSELAKVLGVSLPMVQAAKRLSLSGKVTIGHFAKPRVERDYEALRSIIKRRGIDHVIDMAAVIEAAQ